MRLPVFVLQNREQHEHEHEDAELRNLKVGSDEWWSRLQEEQKQIQLKGSDILYISAKDRADSIS